MNSIKSSILIVLLTGLLLYFQSNYSFAIDTDDTRLLRDPAISQSHIAFVYANDLWVTDLDGKNVKRLTSEGFEVSNPEFSPDGTLIAYSCNRNGNRDVYIIPAEGGLSKRLTYHPSEDLVQEFTRNGKAILFRSSRYVEL